MTVATRNHKQKAPENSTTVIGSAKLAELFSEFWQTKDPYHPGRPLESVVSRYEKGKELRERTPREAHADWSPAPDRPDPVEILLAGNQGRQEQFVPLRMGRMAASPFAFLRGAAAVMAWEPNSVSELFLARIMAWEMKAPEMAITASVMMAVSSRALPL